MASSRTLPGARPPVVAFFLGRVIIWVVLVCACALPLALVTAARFTLAERAAEWLGVFVWVAAMVIIGERLRWPSEARSPLEALHLVMWNRWSNRAADRRSATLRTGALAAAIIHSGLAIVAGPLRTLHLVHAGHLDWLAAAAGADPSPTSGAPSCGR